MTFNKKRSTEGEYEILRFCEKLNTDVIDGASKLLNYFIKEHQPKKLTVFVDRRYNQGDLYKNLGFEFIENSKANCWYFKPHEYVLFRDFKIKKDKLLMSEYEYLKIYDCGYKKFEMKV